MESQQVIDLFHDLDALLDGHFQLSSGLHSSGYLQCALVLQHPAHADALGDALAARVRPLTPNVVLSPALGGVVIGQAVARALGVRGIFAERQDGRLTLRRGFTLTASARVVIIEDVVTTGGSTRATIAVAKASGAVVVGAASIIDRSGMSASFGVPYHALATVVRPAYEPTECPQCAAGVAIEKPGSRDS